MCDIIVRVKQGKLIGLIKEGAYGATYKAFLGIPYALPPIGALRFKDPEPPASWDGVRQASYEKNMSAQMCEYTEVNVTGTEDCLYLNIYVPHECQSDISYKAVMVWIHDGDFHHGSGDYSEARPDYFMKKDVILVTVNYRLSILGFLNLGHENASGNQGLKDQVAALRWIKENIFLFGGDPSNITVFGNGTGAVCAHLLTLSPMSKDLVHKAILQSGVALCNWAIKEEQTDGFLVAEKMGCTSKETEKIIEFFRGQPFRVLLMALSNIIPKKELNHRKVVFGPTVDKAARQPFLPCPVRELLNDNNIPILIGHNTAEFQESYHRIINVSKVTDGHLLNKFDELKLESHVKKCVSSRNLDQVPKYTNKIIKHYGLEKPFDTWPTNLVITCLSDLYYTLPIRSVVLNRVRRENTKTYYYVFSYSGYETIEPKRSLDKVTLDETRDDQRMRFQFRPVKSFDGFTSFDAMNAKSQTSHGEELVYMFYMPRHVKCKDIMKLLRKDYEMVNMVTLIWSNFAKTGDPNFNIKNAYSQWKPATLENNLECFELNKFPTGWISQKKHFILLDNWY